MKETLLEKYQLLLPIHITSMKKGVGQQTITTERNQENVLQVFTCKICNCIT